MKKSVTNPLLAGSDFSLADSFGPQPALIVPSTTTEDAPNTLKSSSSTGFLGQEPSNDLKELQSSFNLSGQDLLPPAPLSGAGLQPASGLPLQRSGSGTTISTPNPVPGASGSATPSLSAVSSTSSLTSLGPPAPGVFLLPTSDKPSMQGVPLHGDPTKPPTEGPPMNFSMGGNALRKPRYAQFVPTNSPQMLAQSTIPPPQAVPPPPSSTEFIPPSTDTQNFQFAPQSSSMLHQEDNPSVPEVAFHWFYLIRENSQSHWKPFSMIDSVAIEDSFCLNPNSSDPIPTIGGRYDVIISERKTCAVYWEEEALPIRRSSWFHRSNTDGRWTPYEEDLAQKLEQEYVHSVQTGQWNKKLDTSTPECPNEYVTLHSTNVMMHFPSNSAIGGNLDEWGQVKPQDPEMKPRVVHRGLEGLPEIPDGEVPEVDHLVFMVHGIGPACDIRFRTINEVVDSFRNLTSDLSEKHFQSSQLAGKVNRIEFLPINWHKTLHGEDTGTDERLRPLTLKSIPKLRNFVNDTLLDILFYTSPGFCQKILDTVTSEINRMYTLFMVRNEKFSGTISLMGHSLGSLILFDLLMHQNVCQVDKGIVSNNEPLILRPDDEDVDLEMLFTKLGLQEYVHKFKSEGIDVESLKICSEEDLKETGMSLGPRKKLLGYLENRRKQKSAEQLSGLDLYLKNAVTSEVKYEFGPAGTGQPFVQYPRLCFQPSCFYALGSPIAMFLSVRGIQTLGSDFAFPTCPRFFHIFHPYDPVAYRIESLINPEFSKLRPVVVPHHKGRKRMHLELKDTVTKLMTTDIRQKIIDSVSATLSTVYNIATGTHQEPSVEKALEDSMTKQATEDELADQTNPRTLDSLLNHGKRIDYVLQEAPLESFNEYLFALASHLCYWESEDTCLFVLKDIYGQVNILCDEENAQRAVPVLGTSSFSQKLDVSPTPILAPPPVPMGGSMPTTSSTPILAPPPVPMGGSMPTTSSTPILAPPPVPMGGSMPTTSLTPILAPPPVPMGGSMPTTSLTPILAPPPVPMGGSMPTTSLTPILAPPPVPMGGTMPTTSSTPILAPPPVPMGGSMPTTSSTPILTSPHVPIGAIPTAKATPILVSPSMAPTAVSAVLGDSFVPITSASSPATMESSMMLKENIRKSAYPSNSYVPRNEDPIALPNVSPVPNTLGGVHSIQPASELRNDVKMLEKSGISDLNSSLFQPPVMSSPVQPLETVPHCIVGASSASNVPSPVGPPPLMSAPIPRGPVKRAGLGRYPLPSPSQTSTVHSNPGIGMDPTAPLESSRPLAPPPTMGFYQKK